MGHARGQQCLYCPAAAMLAWSFSKRRSINCTGIHLVQTWSGSRIIKLPINVKGKLGLF